MIHFLQERGYGQIVNAIVDQDSITRNYIENQLFKEIRKLDGINDILSIIANGKKSYSDIQSRLKGRSNSYAADRLAVLENMGIIRKTTPINDRGNKKKARYEISDNLIRFYFAYFFPNRSAIQVLGGDAFFDSYIQKSLDTFISYRFEGIAREYFSRLARKGMLPGILDIGVFNYDDPLTKRNGEFDATLKFDNGYDVFEVKFLKEKMDNSLMGEEISKIKAIPSLKIRNLGLISSSGFDSHPDGVILITGDDIYNF